MQHLAVQMQFLQLFYDFLALILRPQQWQNIGTPSIRRTSLMYWTQHECSMLGRIWRRYHVFDDVLDTGLWKLDAVLQLERLHVVWEGSHHGQKQAVHARNPHRRLLY